MVKQPDDDLFSASTMTFGEHIEELRVCLGRALLGLLLGFMIGLVVASYVVAWIQTPLTSALQNHYIGKAIDDLTKEYSTEGQPLSPQVVQFIREKRFVFEKIYVEAAELRRVEDLLQGYEVRTDEVDEINETADDATAPQTHPISTAVEADAESIPSAADIGPPIDRGEASAGSQLVILGDRIPAPHPVLITARVWRPIDTLVKALSAQEAFMIWLKAAFVSGLVIASPYIFYQLWLFVAAGLYPHEKQYVYLYLPISILLFLAGAGLAFFVVFEYVLAFLFGFNKMMNIDPDPRISEWLGFVLFLPLGFGIAFQLPLVMLFLHRIGMFTIEAYLEKWRIAVLVIFAIAMLLTPADPVSMLLMAMPLTALYFLGIAMCHWMPRNRSPFAEGYDP